MTPASCAPESLSRENRPAEICRDLLVRLPDRSRDSACALASGRGTQGIRWWLGGGSCEPPPSWRRERDSNPRTFRSTDSESAAFDHSAIPHSRTSRSGSARWANSAILAQQRHMLVERNAPVPSSSDGPRLAQGHQRLRDLAARPPGRREALRSLPTIIHQARRCRVRPLSPERRDRECARTPVRSVIGAMFPELRPATGTRPKALTVVNTGAAGSDRCTSEPFLARVPRTSCGNSRDRSHNQRERDTRGSRRFVQVEVGIRDQHVVQSPLILGVTSLE